MEFKDEGIWHAKLKFNCFGRNMIYENELVKIINLKVVNGEDMLLTNILYI